MTAHGQGTPAEESANVRTILDADESSRSLVRMAHQVVELNRGADDVVVLGIPSRGVPLAARLAGQIGQIEHCDVPLGTLDITMYRDDLRRQPTRAVGPTRIPVSVDGRTVVLVDDVLFSGRTIAAAMEALKDLGRPTAIRLAALIDRGHRELPIQADFVGKDLPTGPAQHVRVLLSEIDGEDQVSVHTEKEA